MKELQDLFKHEKNKLILSPQWSVLDIKYINKPVLFTMSIVTISGLVKRSLTLHILQVLDTTVILKYSCVQIVEQLRICKVSSADPGNNF